MLLAIGLFVLGGLDASVGGIVTAAFGGWFILTGAAGFCPLYVPLGVNTLRKRHILPHTDGRRPGKDRR